MPVRWDIAALEGTPSGRDDAIWAIQPNQLRDIGRCGVLMVLSDSGNTPVSGTASQTAVSVIDEFYYQPPREDNDLESILVAAVAQALFTIRYHEADRQLTAVGDFEAIEEADPRRISPSSSADSKNLSLIAGVVHHDTLYIAYTGQNRAYLWHSGQLLPLTADLSTAYGIQHAQFHLESKDRVLLCTQGLYQNVDESQICQILGTQKKANLATAALLEAAAKLHPGGTVSVAVAHHTRLAPAITLQLGLAAALVIAALAVIALLVFDKPATEVSANTLAPAMPLLTETNTVSAGSVSGGASALQQAPVVNNSVVTATTVPLPTSTTTATPEPTPQPTSTSTSTQEPTPTETNTPTPQPSETASPNTATPVRPTRVPPPTTPPTAVQVVNYARPKLLAPASGWVFDAPNVPTFAWTDVGPLGPDDYYVLAIQHTQGVDEQWVKTTVASARDYLLLLRGPTPFRWSVSIRHKTGKAANGGDAGPILVQSAETWEFSWNQGNAPNPGGGRPSQGTSQPPPQPATAPPPKPTVCVPGSDPPKCQ